MSEPSEGNHPKNQDFNTNRGTIRIFHSEVADALGLMEAAFLAQLHYLLSIPGGKKIGNEQWVWNTLDDWHLKYFQFSSKRAVRRMIDGLEDGGIIKTCQPDGHMSRRKYYRINYAKVRARCGIDLRFSKLNDFRMANLDTSDVANLDTSSTSNYTGQNTSEYLENGWTVRDSGQAEQQGLPQSQLDHSDIFPNENNFCKASCYCVDCRPLKD